MSGLIDILADAGIKGPQIVYVDPDGTRADMIVLTRDMHPTADWAPHLSDRERALLRALLHLAQDRLDASNPHD